MILWLVLLNFLLTLSTFFKPSPGIFAAFVMVNGAAQAAAGGYFQTSLIAVASLFGPPAVQAMIAGQAAVAVVVSGVQVISSASSIRGGINGEVAGDGSAEEKAAFIFFALSTIFLIGSYLAQNWLIKLPIYDQVAGPLERSAQQKIALEVDERPSRRRSLSHVSLSRATAEVVEEYPNVMRVAKANILYEIGVACVFMITLSVFPPITISVSPTNPAFHPLLFAAIHFLVFNISDFLGRWTCSFRALQVWSAKKLVVMSLGRVFFIPLFLMCNVKRPANVLNSIPPISSDVAFMLLMFAFGWTNGYVSTLCLMVAPSVEHNPNLKGRLADVDVAATVASFALVGGLALGSFASFAVRAAICNCNPFIS